METTQNQKRDLQRKRITSQYCLN